MTKTALNIPFIKPDLPPFETVAAQFREILENGKITNFGKYVTQFEQDASAHLGAHAITLSSGTQAMVMALQGLGIKKGQKVILPSFTFMATGQSVIYAGGVPVFADITDDLTLCPKDLAQLLEKHDDVFAVIPVHMYGLPAHVDEIEAVVRSASEKSGRHINVIYDAAHAFGSELRGQKVGTFGDAEVFSLSVTKVVVTVEGGLVTSKNPELIERIRKMRNYGIESNYHTYYPGMNGKMSEFHAIIGVENLKRIGALMKDRQDRAKHFFNRIQSVSSFYPLPWPKDVLHTFKDLTVMTPDKLEGKRDAVVSFLKDRGIETRAYFFPPLHEQEFFQPYVDRALPATEQLSRRVITVPFFATITEEEMGYIADALADAERSLS